MKILKIILSSPRNLIVLMGIVILFFIDFILNVFVIPFAFSIDRIEKAIKLMLNQIK
jgi:hypothetical protein